MTPEEIQKKGEELKEKLLQGLQARNQTITSSIVNSAPGTEWCRTYFPWLFDRPFTAYQQDFWGWADKIEPSTNYRPRVECEPRGVGKSTNAEAAVVKWVATKKRQMIGYVSLNEEKATKHFDSVKSMLESPQLLKDYSHCRPKIQTLRDIAAQWSRDAIITDGNAMVVPLTLLGSSRGWKSPIGKRFDAFVLDDIDALGQSVEFTRKLIELLKGEILAAGDDNTLVLFAQNLIYRDSICSQVLDQRADILSDREFCGPYALLKADYEAEKVDIEGDKTGAKKWVITRGEAVDPAIDIAYAEKLLNKFGKATFDRECQQKVFEIEDDKDFREWSEVYHLITVSEFRRVMESYDEPVWNNERQRLQIPTRWNVGLGFDWGTTRGHPSSVAFVARPSQLSPLKDCHFVFAEVVKPKFPLDSFERPEDVSPGRVATAIQDKLKEWNVIEGQITVKLMSHEASAAMNTMAIDLKDDIKQFFGKWKAQKGSGVPQIQNLLEIDYSKPHPFRTLQGHPINGRPRLYFIVADDQGEVKTDATGSLYVSGARNADGFARARFEMPLYSHKNTAQNKTDDDFVDAFRGLMNIFGVDSDEKTVQEIADEKYHKATIYARPEYKDDHSVGAQMSRAMAQARVLKELKEEGLDFDDDDAGYAGIDITGGY